jgi:hypothetical protein
MCSEVIQKISLYTELDISTVNQIEWHIARSVCVKDEPDCNLEKVESKWLHPKFEMCPFSKTCAAKCYNNGLKKINEPNYKGKSF